MWVCKTTSIAVFVFGSMILASMNQQGQQPGFTAVLPDEIKWKTEALVPGDLVIRTGPLLS